MFFLLLAPLLLAGAYVVATDGKEETKKTTKSDVEYMVVSIYNDTDNTEEVKEFFDNKADAIATYKEYKAKKYKVVFLTKRNNKNELFKKVKLTTKKK